MLPSGGAVCEFRLLSSRFAKGEEVTEAVTFFCFDEEAEKFCESTEKGQLISATGTQETSSYTDGGGTRKSYTKYRLTWYSKGARPRSAQPGNQQGDNPGTNRYGGDRQAGSYQSNRQAPAPRPATGGYNRSNAHQGNGHDQRPQRPVQTPPQALSQRTAHGPADYDDSGYDTSLGGFDEVAPLI